MSPALAGSQPLPQTTAGTRRAASLCADLASRGDRVPDLRNILVFLHVAFVLLFVLIHGASVVIAFRLRGEHDPARVAPLLETSRAAVEGWPFPVALAGFVLTGIALGFMGGYWDPAGSGRRS